MLDWFRKSSGFLGDVDKVVGEADVQGVQAPKEREPNVKRLSDVYDMTFFSLGPAYVFTGINRDILAEIRELVGADFKVLEHRFRTDIFQGMPGWDNLLQAVPTEIMPVLERFMATQIVKRSELDEYWRFRGHTTIIPDPLAVDERVVEPADMEFRLRVFLPTGNKGQYMVPGRLAKLPVVPFLLKPDPAIVMEARAGLQKPITQQEAEVFFKGGLIPALRPETG